MEPEARVLLLDLAMVLTEKAPDSEGLLADLELFAGLDYDCKWIQGWLNKDLGRRYR
jgi:hypothetical protein